MSALEHEGLIRLPALERFCEQCDGTGRATRAQDGVDERCWMCDGAGWWPTEAGHQVLALVRRNLGAMLKTDEADKGLQ